MMFSALLCEQDTVVHIGPMKINDSFVYSTDTLLKERRQKDKEERLSLVLWRRPLTTLQYFLLETLIKLKELTYK